MCEMGKVIWSTLLCIQNQWLKQRVINKKYSFDLILYFQ